MARKVTIQGEDLLESLEDDWGGINETSETIEVYDTPVPPGSEWGMNRGEVENFLKKKLQDSKETTENVNENMPVSAQLGETSAGGREVTLEFFNAQGQHIENLDVNIPAAQEVERRDVRLETTSPNTIEGSTRNVSVDVRFVSRYYDVVESQWMNSGEDATIVIQRQAEGVDGWTEVGRITSFPSSEANTGAYRSINLQPYLQNGTQYIRLVATGNVTGMTTPLLVFTIVVAEMSVSFATDWGNAFVYDEAVPSTANMAIPFHISGNGNKILYYEVYSSGNAKIKEGSIEVGNNEYIESNYQLLLTHPQMVDVLRIKARLRYGNSSIYTDWTEQNVMVSMDGDNTVLLCVNNITPTAYNWTTQHLLDYAVYNPNVLTASTVSFELMDNDEQTSWMSFANGNVVNGNTYDLTPYLSIENQQRLFGAKLKVSVQGVLMKTVSYSVDNSNSFAPTAGANFVLMPSSRSNYDNDRETIHNETTLPTEPALIPATWENVVFENDGWVSEGDVKMLRLFSGSKLTIPYESYSNTTQRNGLTIELDFRVRNIGDEEQPFFKMGGEVAGSFVGLILYPKKGYFFKATNNVDLFQDVEWRENTRTHIAVNIMPNLTVKGRTVNLVRMFINGIINREFLFNASDAFWNGSDSGGIQIGGASADVDVFGIRIFKERGVSSSEILNDYVASVSDIATKLSIIEANNITEGGVIKYALAKEKYNTIVWHGDYPDKNNQVTTTGNLQIKIIGDPAHSGTINNMSCKGQGTSSKRYLYWNGSWGFNDDSVFVNDNGEQVGSYYKLRNTSPKATKLVGKINWASSPQSHKAGMCDIVNVLHEAIFDGSASGFEPSGIRTLEGYENTKIAVEEEPFLFFVQADESAEPVFYGNMTFGSAKGDKLTFGYNKSHPQLKNYLMIEGSDQTPVLTLCQVPWFEDEVTYNEEEEYYEYNGMGSFDVTLGNRDSITHFIQAFNLCFFYSTRIKYYNGRLDQLQLDTAADKSYQYFIVGQTFDNFKVYRYDWLTDQWVNAGITKTNGVPDEVNVNTQLDLNFADNNADFEGMLAAVKAARIEKFRQQAGNYFHVNDTLFGMQINKFMAASDNRAKNTYPYYDPVDGLVRFASDDNDTILPFNNQGQKQKPYWVEEHDFDNRPSFNSYFWAASGNAMYNLFEDAYPDELRSMMRKIMTTMSNLGTGYGEGGIMGFFDKLFFKIQRYFPAVAYNECARLWYEWAKILYDAGEYTNDTDPITQSLGDQLQCEKEWLSRRIVYMASYCMYDAALGGSIEFRKQNSVVFHLVPAIKMYLYMRLGISYRYPAGYNVPKRCEAGETVDIPCEGSDSIQTFIVAAEYLRSLGDLAPMGVSGSTAFSNGKRLDNLKLGDSNAAVVRFKPNAIVSFPSNATSIDLRNIGESLTSIGSLAGLSKLADFLATNTNITAIELPQTNNLRNVYLNDSLTTLVIRNQNNIVNFVFNPTNLRNLTIGNTNIDEQHFIESWINGISGNLSEYSLTADGINWANFSAANLVKLCGFNTLILKGTINIDSNSISGAQYLTIYGKLGALINSGELRLVYTNKISIEVTPQSFVGGLQEAHIVISSLNADPMTISFDGQPSSPYLNIVDLTDEIVLGQRRISGTLVANEVEGAVVTVYIAATDGSTTSEPYPVYIRPIIHILSVQLSVSSIYVSSIGPHNISASLAPAGYSDTPTLQWSIDSIKDTENYYIGSDSQNYYVKRFVDNSTIAVLPRSGNAFQNAIIFNELIPQHNNEPDIVVRCDVYDGSNLRATNTMSLVAHAYYQPYALQSYDEEELNYNPGLMIALMNATNNCEAISEDFLNDHAYIYPDGRKGYHISIDEAALLPYVELGTQTFEDTQGVVYKSYESGTFMPGRTYLISSLYCCKDIKVRIQRNPAPSYKPKITLPGIGFLMVQTALFNGPSLPFYKSGREALTVMEYYSNKSIINVAVDILVSNVSALAVDVVCYTSDTPTGFVNFSNANTTAIILIPKGRRAFYEVATGFVDNLDRMYEYDFRQDKFHLAARYDGTPYMVGDQLVNAIKAEYGIE